MLARSIFFACLILFSFPHTAWAHSFNVVFVAPLSETVGQSMLDGFLIATKEQDSHAFEEADGHLGGLDSYIQKINLTNQELSAIDLEYLTQEETPIFAAGFVSTTTVKNLLEASRIVVVDPVMSKFWQSAVSNPEGLKLMDGGSFTTRFKNTQGYPPNKFAIKGYLAARVIANVVRNSSEQVLSDPIMLQQAVRRELQKSSL
jgi:hypothetical protein